MFFYANWETEIDKFWYYEWHAHKILTITEAAKDSLSTWHNTCDFFSALVDNFYQLMLIINSIIWLVGWRIKANCPLICSGPVGGVPYMGVFLSCSSPDFREFRRKQGKLRAATSTSVTGDWTWHLLSTVLSADPFRHWWAKLFELGYYFWDKNAYFKASCPQNYPETKRLDRANLKNWCTYIWNACSS